MYPPIQWWQWADEPAINYPAAVSFRLCRWSLCFSWKKIAETKQLYYQALNDSQVGWREGTEDVTPFIKYLLQIIIAAYRDFEERIDIVDQKSTAVDQVHEAINMKIGKFTKSEIIELCPGLSRSAVEKSLRELVEKNVIVKRGVGRGTYYLRSDSFV